MQIDMVWSTPTSIRYPRICIRLVPGPSDINVLNERYFTHKAVTEERLFHVEMRLLRIRYFLSALLVAHAALMCSLPFRSICYCFVYFIYGRGWSPFPQYIYMLYCINDKLEIASPGAVPLVALLCCPGQPEGWVGRSGRSGRSGGRTRDENDCAKGD